MYPVQPSNAIGFDVSSFAMPVPNDSHRFDYYRHNAGRRTTARREVAREVQARPKALDHMPTEETVVLPSVGAVLLFSGAQLHRTIPNTSAVSRYSIDFRTVFVPDLVAGRGARCVDAHCTGTAIRDFVNVADERSFDEELVVRTCSGAPPAGAHASISSGRTALNSRRPSA